MQSTTVPHNLDGGDFYGTSRSVTSMPVHRRAWPTCRRCGSTLAGYHLERVSAATRTRPYDTSVYRCRVAPPAAFRRQVTA